MKKITIILFCFFIGFFTSCTKSVQNNASNGGDSIVNDTTVQKAIFKQFIVGTRDNSQESGSWWGENITKILHYGSKSFTIVIDNLQSPRTAYLYEKKDGEEWIEGQAFAFSRFPNILIDPNGYIHIIGFEAFDYLSDPYSGRICEIKFNTAETVMGAYTKNYLTDDYRATEQKLSNFASLFCGAAIGNNSKILVAYNNTLKLHSPNNHSLGVRIFDGTSWTFESVTSNLTSNYAYPFAFVSDSYYHVYAVEDDYDAFYETAGTPYSNYCYRYGAIKHFQRPISGGAWIETTLLNLNDTKTKTQIWDATLRITDFHVDYSGTIHAILRYNTNSKPFCYHYSKKETESSWRSETILASESNNTGLPWAKIWERNDHKLFYVCYFWGGQILLNPINTTTLYKISNLEGNYKYDPTPFISSSRSGTPLSSNLYISVYSGSNTIKALSLDVSTAGL